MASAPRQRHRNKVTQRVNIGHVELVVLSSDDEVEVAPAPAVVHPRNDACEWIHTVTRAIQNLKSKQTLHIPAWVVEDRMQTSTQIEIRSAVNNRSYKGTIINPGRGLYERYIVDGWYDYLDDHKPRVGDILVFAVKSPRLMVVDLIRRKRRSD